MFAGCWSCTVIEEATMRRSSRARALFRLVPTAVFIAAIAPLSAFGQAEPPAIATHHDTIPNPCHSSVHGGATAIVAVTDGDWSAAGIWNLNRQPLSTDVVFIPAGRTVWVNTTGLRARNVCVHGTLGFRESVSSQLIATNVVIFSDGTFQMGTDSTPIAAHAVAELVIEDTPLNTAVDPAQYHTALLVWGRIRIHGATRTPPWQRLAAEVAAAQTTLQLSQSVAGWRAGDRLIVPGSNQMLEDSGSGGGKPDSHRWEERIVQSISGTTVTVTQGFTHAHPGARSLAGALELLPHVGNLSRNAVIRSRTPSEAGKAGYCTETDKLDSPGSCVTRGHALFTFRANVDVRYALFLDLGRTLILDLDSTTFDSGGTPTRIGTNQIGRYPVHAHHLLGPFPTVDPTYQFRLIGNAIDGGTATHQFKWGVAIHDSHYGLIQSNVVYNYGGAGIMFEDGSESYNVLEANLVVRNQGLGPRETGTNATEGTNYYFRGPNNYVRYNVGANALEAPGDVEAAYFMKYNFVYLGNVRIPRFRGADTQANGEYDTRDGNQMAILENVGNEGYGSMQGFTNWWTCSQSGGDEGDCDHNPAVPSHRSIIKDMTLWHFTRYPYYGYPQQNVTFDGWKVRGHVPSMPSCCQQMWWGDYATHNLTIRNADIQGIRGFTLPYWAGGTTTVEDSLFGTRFGVAVRISQAPGACPGCNLPNRRQVFRNVRFTPFPSQPLETISMSTSTDGDAVDLVTLDQTIVCNHNGTAGDSFQLYYLRQDPTYTLAADSGHTRGCPGGAMTNQSCWAQYGKAYAGALAPCPTQRPSSSGLDGFVCATELSNTICSSSVGIPGAPTNLRLVP
jgi:hypothetical protein